MGFSGLEVQGLKDNFGEVVEGGPVHIEALLGYDHANAASLLHTAGRGHGV